MTSRDHHKTSEWRLDCGNVLLYYTVVWRWKLVRLDAPHSLQVRGCSDPDHRDRRGHQRFGCVRLPRIESGLYFQSNPRQSGGEDEPWVVGNKSGWGIVIKVRSMVWYKRDVAPVRQQWSYVSLALSHRDVVIKIACLQYVFLLSCFCVELLALRQPYDGWITIRVPYAFFKCYVSLMSLYTFLALFYCILETCPCKKVQNKKRIGKIGQYIAKLSHFKMSKMKKKQRYGPQVKLSMQQHMDDINVCMYFQ